MIAGSCWAAAQVLNLSGDEATEPGKFLEPIFEGSPLEKKDGTQIYTFGAEFSENEDYKRANPGGSHIYSVFVATSEVVDLEAMELPEVPFVDSHSSRGLSVKKKSKAPDFVTACKRYTLS